jgi:hypothetical protein
MFWGWGVLLVTTERGPGELQICLREVPKRVGPGAELHVNAQ